MPEDRPSRALPDALHAPPGGPAAEIMRRADRDIVLVVKLLGESRHLLQQHFQDFVRDELARRGIRFGDHPLLLPFIETHGGELAEFVISGIALHHQFRLSAFEAMSGDPHRLLRVDVWNTLQSYIDKAEAHFVSDIGGLQQILQAVDEARDLRVDRDEDGREP